eukprot:TRINITY_DN12948_c0_g1_i1.p1 TRINITY_DN12948_c0_g1~~TRINITY_DN12948_c0_g1_i1.p1  ORF type:complete len:196 (-),score=59.22 TRINITY_DN12948_c0_g1_i1:50-637(-)
MKRALQAESGQGIGGISAEDAQNLALQARRDGEKIGFERAQEEWSTKQLHITASSQNEMETTLNKERQNWKDKIEELELQMAMAEKALVVEYNTKYSTMKQQIEAEIRDSRDTTVDMTELESRIATAKEEGINETVQQLNEVHQQEKLQHEQLILQLEENYQTQLSTMKLHYEEEARLKVGEEVRQLFASIQAQS